MVVRMRHTRGHRNGVRSHHALKQSGYTKCGHCGKDIPPHIVCQNCGYYAGRKVVDVLAKLDKKQRKQKEKELSQHNHDHSEEK